MDITTQELAYKIKTIKMQTHTRDCFHVVLKDAGEKQLLEESGYVPMWMPGGPGDDVVFEIDNATGRILNWVPIKDEVLETDEEL